MASVLVSGYGNAPFGHHYDDIYFSTGKNLAFIPEPSTAVMVGMALGLLALCQFRRRSRRG